MMFRYINAGVFIWLFSGTVVAQLPPRPKDGAPEPAISEEQQAEVAKLLENYSANFRKLERYACAVWLEKTAETYGEGVAFYEYWAMHARDNQLPMRRLDHIRQLLATNPRFNNGLPSLSTFHLTTFESPKTAFQVQGNSPKHKERPATENDEDLKKFTDSFQKQFDVDPWVLPFDGFRNVGSQGRKPWRQWFEQPLFPGKLQKACVVTALSSDIRTTMVRFGRKANDSSLAYDVVFSKLHGNMPIKCILSYNDKVYRGVATSSETTWELFKIDRNTSVYLPVRVLCTEIDGPPQKPTGKSNFDGVISWLVNKDVPDFVFDTTEANFLNADELRDRIQANALNK
jgi:hypothetical protein